MTNFKPDDDLAEWDAAYDYLAGGNAQVLESLHRRFADESVKPK